MRDWRSRGGHAVQDVYRPGMARDLIQTKALIGKEYWEMTALLGDPDVQEASHTVKYVLEENSGPGRRTGRGGIYEDHFGPKGKVKKVEIEFLK